MKIRCCILPLILALGSNPALAAPISDAQAMAHIGQTMTVEGVVTGTHVTAKGTEFLDFGPRYPNQDFTAVIFGSSASQFGDVANYYGKRVDVTGKLELYRGKAEVILRSAHQLRVVP